MTTNKEWEAHAYPLQQITIKLQGTRHSDLDAIVGQLERIAVRLRSGQVVGEESDDDFGYLFEVDSACAGPSFFDEPATSR